MSARGDRVAVGARLVRKNGAVAAVVVVKATFALVPGGVMTLAEPRPIQASDRFHKDDPRRSVLAASDLVPELPGGEVTLVGSAHASPPMKLRGVRLAVTRGQRSLVDKTLHVHGDRSAAAGAPAPEPAPFTSMPLVYERAYGGAGFHDNPCGVGAAVTATMVYPNVVYPEAVRANVPAGFGPIAAANASRKRHLAAGAEAGLGAQVMEYDERTPLVFFHAAPADQRVERLFGDETMTLGGLSKDHPLLETSLPSAVARATIQPKEGAAVTLPLALDTIQIDGDAGTASLLFRGRWALPNEDALVGLAITGALALPDGSVHERVAPALPQKAPPPRRAAAAPGTVMLDGAGGVDSKMTAPLGIDSTPKGPATPFPDQGRSPSSKPSAPIPGAPWTGGPSSSSSPAPARPGMPTLAPDDEEAPLATRATMAISLDALFPKPAESAIAPPSQTIPAAPEVRTVVPAPSAPMPPIATPAPNPPAAERKPDGPVYKNVPVQEQPIAPAKPAVAAPARPKPPNIRSKLYSR